MNRKLIWEFLTFLNSLELRPKIPWFKKNLFTIDLNFGTKNPCRVHFLMNGQIFYTAKGNGAWQVEEILDVRQWSIDRFRESYTEEKIGNSNWIKLL